MEKNWRKVGKIKHAHGLKGELDVFIFSEDVTWSSQLKSCLLKKENLEKVYSVEAAKPFKLGLIIKLEGVSNRTAAEELKGADFSIQDDLLVSESGESIYLNEIENFSVKNPDGMTLGQIIGFSTNNAQDLLVVQTDKGEFEIPFVEDFIIEINFDEKAVFMELPPGLLGEEE